MQIFDQRGATMMDALQGAAVVRRRAKRNPMEVLVEMREGDPTADSAREFKAWKAAILADDDLTDAALRYAYTNMASGLERTRVTVRKSKARAKAERRAEKRLVQNIVERVAKVAFLQLDMPNGKKLKDCTFADCGAFGGFYKKLALKGRPSELVGKKMTDEDIRGIFAKPS